MSGPTGYFYKLKIRYKLLLILGATTLSMAIGSTLVSRSMINRFNQSLYESVATTLQLASRIVERELNEARDLVLETATDETLQSALDNIRDAESDYQREQEYQRITTILRRYATKNKAVPFTAYIGPDEGDRLLSSAPIPTILPDFVTEEMEGFTTREYSSRLILPPNSLENFWVIINVRRINDYSLIPQGLLVATVDMNAIADLYTREPATPDAILAIYSNGIKIFETHPSPAFDTAVLDGESTHGFWISESGDSPFLAAFVKSSELDFDYIYFSPTGAIRNQTRLRFLVLVGILICLAILSAGGAYRLAGYFTRPLENLRDQLEEMVNGEFSPVVLDTKNYSGEDEIATFYRDFQIMAGRIQTLLKENYQKTIETQEARLSALELQMNPHFLYNTLNSINWLALSGKSEDVSTMTGALSSLLRRTLELDKPSVTLETELKHLEDYIAIQKIRFGERLRWHNQVGHNFFDIEVPPLILQPIVENSIVHGLEPRKEGCSITLSTAFTGGLIEIRVEDDGPGLRKKQNTGTGIGLGNIRNRLRIIYGEKASLEMYEVEPHGVGAMVRLPIQWDSEVNGGRVI